MPNEQRQVVKLFLASPSDLAAERKIAKEIVDKINRQWAEFFSLHVELVGWEDSTSAYRRPQDIINQDLEQCEFFVGMLWHEWGKPNDKYSSGFEEEYRLSEESLSRTGRPTISLLFKKMDQSRLRDPGPGLVQVQRFKEEVHGKVLYKTFDDEDEFRDRFERVVTDYIQRLKRTEQRESVQVAPVEGEGIQPDNVPPKVEGQPQIPLEALAFVKSFAAKAGKDPSIEPVNAEEVARFRLLGTLITEQGNDDATIGVHDANLLLVSAQAKSFTWTECAALVDAGLTHFDAENIPYWRWLAAVQGLDGDFLPIRTLYGTAARRAGALKLMRLMQLKIPSAPDFSRSDYLDSWLNRLTPHQVREAALRYLVEFGTLSDLEKVKEEIDRADSQTVKAARDAYVSILLCQSAAKGLDALLELQAESFEAATVERVFARPAVLPIPELEQCLAHKSSQLRARAAAALRDRRALSPEAAARLSVDEVPDVRLQGLLGRLAAGEVLAESTAKGILVRRQAARSVLSAFTLAGSSTQGEKQFEEFVGARRQRLKLTELRREISIGTIFSQEYHFEEMRRSFKTRGRELRGAVDNQFKTWFSNAMTEIEKFLGNPETVQKVKDIEESLRKQWTRNALNIVLSKGECQDLPLLRKALATGFISINKCDVDFFRKCGEWQDVSTVLAFSESSSGSSLGSFFGTYMSADEVVWLAKALLKIAGNRLRDLLSLTMSERIKAAIMANAPPGTFRQLANSEILEFLKSSNDAVRRETSLKCVMALTKTRLSSLMDSHLAFATDRYYNVSLWLDLGVSVERSQSASIAKRRTELQE